MKNPWLSLLVCAAFSLSLSLKAGIDCSDYFKAIREGNELRVFSLSYQFQGKAGQCRNSLGHNAIHVFASWLKDANIFSSLKYLAKTDLNGVTIKNETPLMVAAYFGNLGAAELLLNDGSVIKSINNQDNGGRTALHWAVLGKQIDLVELLLSYAPLESIRDNEGQTALALARKFNHLEIKELLGDVPDSKPSHYPIVIIGAERFVPSPISSQHSIN